MLLPCHIKRPPVSTACGWRLPSLYFLKNEKNGEAGNVTEMTKLPPLTVIAISNRNLHEVDVFFCAFARDSQSQRNDPSF